jgi:peptide/nickel transport system permease protein
MSGQVRYAAFFLRNSKLTLLGLVIVVVAVVLAVIGPYIGPYNPEATNPADALQPPNLMHLFGTDQLGMDIFSRVLAAPRIDILIAVIATAISLAIGIPLGVLAGQSSGGGRVASGAGEFLMRSMDILQAFPVFILAMGLVAALGPNPVNLTIAVAFVNAPVFLRLVRGEVLSLQGRAYTEAAIVGGASDMRVGFRHLMPNSLSSALVQASITIGWAVLLTAGLSFVGAGVRVPTPEWGSMISIGARNMITGEWWIVLFPGIALGLTVLGFGLLGDGLRVYLDPTQRR